MNAQHSTIAIINQLCHSAGVPADGSTEGKVKKKHPN
jgi:hypothetical protein